ncbi:MAG: PocR ligand-binding domain-containing protein, partial [Ruminococcus sp.]|nr:PocR ligand-binding domain-containing protein [Ruminococcus sp.]
GMAALTTDKNGIAITKGSNFSDFCMKYTRRALFGHIKCEKCDKTGAEITLKNGKPCSYYCHAGLVDFAAPIMANGKMVGGFIGGQVLTEPPDLDKFAAIAADLKIPKNEYLEAVKKVRIVDKQTVDKAAHFLYILCDVLSNITFRSYELHKSNIEIEKAAHIKSDFLANMSHEIRTPMNAVLGMADLALREDMSDAARDYIKTIKTSSKTLLVIINDILDFSKIESGKMEINEVVYEPLSEINDLAGIAYSRIGDKDIEFTMDVAPDMPQNLYGDNVRIHQIILNLLTNGIKFTRHGQVHLEMKWEKTDEDTALIKVSVTDTGIGIKKENLNKLFNSFQQVDSKRNRNIEGTGLGLAISKELLRLMNGTISVESEYEKGSRFFFEVPQKIIDGAPSIPKPDKKVSAAILVGSKYVKDQLISDLKWIDADYIDLSAEGSMEESSFDYLIFDKVSASQPVKDFLRSNPNVKSILIDDYGNTKDPNMPNTAVLSKPVYSLGLYNAMGIVNYTLGIDTDDKDGFVFTAPDAKVLIVDDNRINLTVASGLLEPLEMQIDLANSAAEAIDMIQRVQYDMVFMDHMMPEVDGVETTRIIRRMIPSYNDVPIIALTANAAGGAKDMFIREGMNDFVSKPIEVKTITAKIRQWLPQEKIIPVEKKDREAAAPAEKDPVMSIKELDVRSAVSLLGSESLFKTVLKEYYMSIDKKSRVIQEHKDAMRWRDYTVEVHSLKSTSKQIGADFVSLLAAELEQAGNERDINLIMFKTDKLLEEYRKFKAILAPYFPDCEIIGGQTPPDNEKTKELLKRFKLSIALENFDTLQIDEVLEEMSGYAYVSPESGYFVSLRDCAEVGDLDGCFEIIEKWNEFIGG